MSDYGPAEHTVHYAREYRHPKLRSRPLMIPLVDHDIFNTRGQSRAREGFLVYGVRYKPDLATVPEWARPFEIVSRDNVRTPEELAELSRRALIVWEHTSAIGEAMHCGCAVVMIPSPRASFRRLTLRCLGCGHVRGWNEAAIGFALKSVWVATLAYRVRYAGLERRIHKFVRQARRYFDPKETHVSLVEGNSRR